MIEKVEVYIVVCDECDEKYDGHGDGGHSVFDEASEAKGCATSDDWIINDKETLCCQCASEKKEKP